MVLWRALRTSLGTKERKRTITRWVETVGGVCADGGLGVWGMVPIAQIPVGRTRSAIRRVRLFSDCRSMEDYPTPNSSLPSTVISLSILYPLFSDAPNSSGQSRGSPETPGVIGTGPTCTAHIIWLFALTYRCDLYIGAHTAYLKRLYLCDDRKQLTTYPG